LLLQRGFLLVYRLRKSSVNKKTMTAKTLKLLSEQELRQALAGHKDILTDADADSRRFFATLSCPYCQGREIMRQVNPQQLFRQGEVIPNYLAMCKACGCEFEPYTGIAITLPQPKKVS
jgi:hypothetical protein